MRYGKGKWILVALAILVVVFLFWSLWPLRQPLVSISATRVLDRNGGLLYEVPHPDFGVTSVVTLSEIPMSVRRAVIASEDATFYKHHGVDWTSFARAFLLFDWRGVSTLEQQVVKMVYYPDKKRGLLQKAREIIGAMIWSATHRKDETLQTYLNRAYFGNRYYGLAAASRGYFNKGVSDITVGEAAMLVGLLPAPARYEPYRHWEEAKQRQALVLERMGETANDESIVLTTPRLDMVAPHLALRILQDLESRYPDIETGGYTIITTIDPALQSLAEKTVKRRLAELKDQRVGNAAVMALDPIRGEVLAYVGSADFYNDDIDGQVDMVQAKRQPGSTLKPFLYFAAFGQDFTPATVVADLPVRFDTADGRPYYPRNYGYRYLGPVSIRDALGSSLNIPAVKVLDRIGLLHFFSVLNHFGLSFEQPPDFYGLGIVLGGGEVTLADMTRAYGSLALSGKSVQSVFVQSIQDAAGNDVYASQRILSLPLYPPSQRSAQAAALIADILSDKAARIRSFGEANLLDVGKRIAVKTGTTKDFRDNWAFGYTPDFVLGVWVGNADNTPMEGVSGITGAVPIWHDIMLARFGKGPEINWPQPEGLVSKQICTTSGLLATDLCPKQRLERFMVGTEPTSADTWYQSFDIDARTGGLATAACRDNVVPQVFLVVPPEYQAWSVAANHQQPPALDCTGKPVAGASRETVIISPLDGDTFEIDHLVDRALQRVPFMAGGGQAPYHWVLNGQSLKSQESTVFWDPMPGEYTLKLNNRQVRFTVR